MNRESAADYFFVVLRALVAVLAAPVRAFVDLVAVRALAALPVVVVFFAVVVFALPVDFVAISVGSCDCVGTVFCKANTASVPQSAMMQFDVTNGAQLRVAFAFTREQEIHSLCSRVLGLTANESIPANTSVTTDMRIYNEIRKIRQAEIQGRYVFGKIRHVASQNSLGRQFDVTSVRRPQNVR